MIEKKPNAVTVAALKEAKRGRGKTYRGTTEQVIAAMLRQLAEKDDDITEYAEFRRRTDARLRR